MVLRCGVIGATLMCPGSLKRSGAEGIGIGATLMCSRRYVSSTSIVLRCGLIGATLMWSQSLKRFGDVTAEAHRERVAAEREGGVRGRAGA